MVSCRLQGILALSRLTEEPAEGQVLCSRPEETKSSVLWFSWLLGTLGSSEWLPAARPLRWLLSSGISTLY